MTTMISKTSISKLIKNYPKKMSIDALSMCKHFHITTTRAELVENPVYQPTKRPESKRMIQFRKKLRESIDEIENQSTYPAEQKEDPLPPWPNNTNPHTGEIGGPRGLEPTRYGDWERKGICSDF